MATLSVADRTKVWRGVMRICSRENISWPNNVDKYDLYNPTLDTGVITDTDDWIDTHQGETGNTTGYNGALSDPWKSNASLQIKTFVFMSVAAMRSGESFAERLLGGLS